MLRRETLFVINFLERWSTPISRSWMHSSKFSISLWRFSIDEGLWLTKHCKAAFTFWNSFVIDCWESQSSLFGCTNLDIADHVLCCECPFGPEINSNKCSSELSVIVSASFKKLSMGEVLLFLCFKLFRAFWICFFIFFLIAKYVIPSTADPFSVPFVRRMNEFKWVKLSLDLRRQSWAVAQISKSLREPSSKSSTHLPLHCLTKACCSNGNWSNLSMHSCKSSMSLSLWPTEDDDDDDDDEVDSEPLNFCKCSSNCDTSGWAAEGKLLLRWCREFWIVATIFCSWETDPLESNV